MSRSPEEDPEAKQKEFQRKRWLRRLARQRDDPRPQPKRTQVGLRKTPQLNQKRERSTKPTRKERQPNYGAKDAKIVFPTVGSIAKGPIRYGAKTSPELVAAIRGRETDRMAKESASFLEKVKQSIAEKSSTPGEEKTDA